jgi:hypothetical protein
MTKPQVELSRSTVNNCTEVSYKTKPDKSS